MQLQSQDILKEGHNFRKSHPRIMALKYDQVQIIAITPLKFHEKRLKALEVVAATSICTNLLKTAITPVKDRWSITVLQNDHLQIVTLIPIKFHEKRQYTVGGVAAIRFCKEKDHNSFKSSNQKRWQIRRPYSIMGSQ